MDVVPILSITSYSKHSCAVFTSMVVLSNSNLSSSQSVSRFLDKVMCYPWYELEKAVIKQEEKLMQKKKKKDTAKDVSSY